MSVEWYTPRWLTDELGYFDLDPCSASKDPNLNHACTNYRISEGMNGLEEPWSGRVWLNPPYGRNLPYWLEKMARHNDGIALLYARVDAKWFHQFVFAKAAGMLFLKGRIRFEGYETRSKRTPSPCVLVAYGHNNLMSLWRSSIEGYITFSAEQSRDYRQNRMIK